MSSDRKAVVKFDFGILGALGTVFVVLKLAEVQPFASWSWWWVVAPFWIGLAAPFAFLIVAAIAVFLFTLLFTKR